MIVTELVKNFSHFYETQRFIIVFTKSHHWSPSWGSSIQFSLPLHSKFLQHSFKCYPPSYAWFSQVASPSRC